MSDIKDLKADMETIALLARENRWSAVKLGQAIESLILEVGASNVPQELHDYAAELVLSQSGVRR